MTILAPISLRIRRAVKRATTMLRFETRPAGVNLLNQLNANSVALEGIQAQLAQMQQAALAQRFDEGSRSQSTATALLAASYMTRAARLPRRVPNEPGTYARARGIPLDEQFRRLEALDPEVFPQWKRLFENGKRSYYEQKEASCSHRDHWYARLFGAYIDVMATGRLLDVGCGPHGLPSYLNGYDLELVSGIDPLEPSSATPFEFVQGFNEFLPWPDRSFNTVVSGTSLDHVLSLEHSLAEVGRVLTENGRYIVWLASIPGSPPYDPRSRPVVPRDEFHLFHFCRTWIEPIFERYFVIADIVVIAQPGFDHLFYCMQPKQKGSVRT